MSSGAVEKSSVVGHLALGALFLSSALVLDAYVCEPCMLRVF